MVGKAFLSVLEEKFFVNAEVDLLASKKSEGKKVTFRGSEYVITDLAEYDFSNTDLALFSAGASVSAKFAPIAVSVPPRLCFVRQVPEFFQKPLLPELCFVHPLNFFAYPAVGSIHLAAIDF